METLAALALALAPSLAGPAPQEIFVQGVPGEAVEDRVVRGVVVDALTREPVPGHAVVVQRFSQVRGEPVVADAEGRFELTVPGREALFATVAAAAAPGLRAVEAVKVQELAGEVELALKRVPTAPLVGVALTKDGEPVPHFIVTLSEVKGPSEAVVTDAFGRFESTVEFAAARMFAYPLENGSTGSAVRFEHELAPVELRFEVGERVLLDFAPPPGLELDDFRVHPLTPEQHPAFAWGNGVELRAGGLPWVRFSARSWPRYEPTKQDLYLKSNDGTWGVRVPRGQGEPPRVQARSLGVLNVTLRPDARTAMRAANPEQYVRAGHDWVNVGLTHLDDGAGATTYAGSLPPGNERELACLEPGRWRLDVREGTFPASSVEFTIGPGQVLPLEVPLGSPNPSADLVLRVLEGDGDVPDWEGLFDAPDVDAWVSGNGRTYTVQTAAMCGTGVDAWFQRVERDGRMVLEATVTDLPLGEYEVTLRVGGRSFEGPALAEPGEPAVYVLGESRFGFRVTDAVTGRPVELYRVVELGDEPPGLLAEHPDPDGVHARGVERNDLPEWCVRAPGYRPLYGRSWDFDTGPDGGWAEVELERGWGLRVVAQVEGEESIEGATARFGAEEHRFDRRGVILLTAPLAPAEPRLTFDGWQPVTGDVAPDGTFDPTRDELRVTLRRR